MNNKDIPNSLQASLRVLRTVPDLYLLLNPKLEIIEVSDAYLKATKTERDKIIGRRIFDVFPDNPNDLTATGVNNLSASLERVLQLKIPDAMAVQKYDITRPASEGGGFEERYWSPLNLPVLGQNNEVLYIIHRAEDVTAFVKLKKSESEKQKVTEKLQTHVEEMEREVFKRAQEIQEINKQLRTANEELARLAYFDSLTGLANRKRLDNKIKKFLELAKRAKWMIAVLFLDLDEFKLINDTLGHKIGDLLLQIVAKRLTKITQINDLVARLGGDEFIILLNRINDVADVAKVAQRILQKIAEPFLIEDHELVVSGSVGISLYPENGEDPVTLLKHADIAMYAAKQSGKNSYQFFNPEMVNNIQKK